ncbi:terminase small subunit [Escherichia coli]|uniref:terminase small subunit n=1 Tax=Escherichia coli TaxID=562 RepID=UPI002237E7DE|nr:terminase small subunit [Escherichia coli]MCW7275386.1 terminase small subunit [Escherichia coli]
MNVNKKKLADILALMSGPSPPGRNRGYHWFLVEGKGTESVFDTTAAIQWYAQREADIEKRKTP